MLLVIDVGNTNTVLGVFARVAKVNAAGDSDETPRYERLVANWRVATSRTSGRISGQSSGQGRYCSVANGNGARWPMPSIAGMRE